MERVSYQKSTRYDKAYRYQKDKELNYISRKKFQQHYPKNEGGYRVIGMIGEATKQAKGELVVSEEVLPFYPLEKKQLCYEIIGYIEVEQDVYIAILESRKLKISFQILALMILLLGGGYYLSIRNHVPIDAGAGKYQAPIDIPDNVDSSQISIPGYSDIRIKAGTDIAYVALWNPDENPCYFVFTIVDRTTQEELYQSEMVPPSYAISEVKLAKTIEQGVHPVTIRISTYDLKNHKTKLNGGEVNANLVGVTSDEEKK